METFPSKLSDFLIQGELGRGSYGVVYRVQSKTDGQVYVMKKINVAALSQRHRAEAQKEVQILKLLSHPHIIKYFTSFVEDNAVHIIMEFAEGGDLQRLLRTHRDKQRHFAEKEVWRYAFELSSAVAYLHEHSIIHRDIKCMNVLLSRENHVKLGDLGASKITENAAMHLTRVGTPLYLAPELVKQTPYDFKVDIWALGCVLYFLTNLEAPFQGDNLIALGNSILFKRPKPIPSQYSPKLSAFILRLLEKRPRDRPSISEVLSLIPQSYRQKLDIPQSMEDLSTNFTLLKEIREDDGKREQAESPQSPLRSPRVRKVRVPEQFREMIEKLEKPIVRAVTARLEPSVPVVSVTSRAPVIERADAVKPTPLESPRNDRVIICRPKTASAVRQTSPARPRVSVKHLQEAAKPLISVLRRSESTRFEEKDTILDLQVKGQTAGASAVIEAKEPLALISAAGNKVTDENKLLLRRIFDPRRPRTAVNHVRIAEREVVEVREESPLPQKPILRIPARPMSAAPKSTRVAALFKPPKLQALLHSNLVSAVSSDNLASNASKKKFSVKDLLDS